MLIPYIESISLTAKEHWHTTYLSLYGISDCNQMMRMLLYSRLPRFGKARSAPALIDAFFDIPRSTPKVGGYAEAIGKLYQAIEKLFSTRMNFQKHVILLDDLERVGPDVQISQLFGLAFSQLIEPAGNKVLFIGNETVLEDRWKDYKIVREKTVRRVLLFQPDLREQIRQYIEKKYAGRSALLSFLLTNIDIVVELWSRVKEHNLRSLGFAIDNFAIVHAFRDRGDLGGLLIEFLELILMLSIEFKEGALSPNDVSDFKDLDNLQSAIATWRIQSERGKEKEGADPYYVAFYKKYVQGAKRRFVFSRSIYNLVLSGAIDLDRLPE